MSSRALILAIVIGIVAIAGLTYFVDAFADWNKQQACATAGHRNC